MLQILKEKARKSFLGSSNLAEPEDDELDYNTNYNEGEIERLYKLFLVVDSSLSKYSKTCSSFAEVTALLQEGVDQLTAQVLSFCSSLEENQTLLALEQDALNVRERIGCEDEILCKVVSEHLLEPIGVRLRKFEDMKVRMKERGRLKRKYESFRKRVGRLRIDRHCDEENLFKAEEELKVIGAELKNISNPLLDDLRAIYKNRSKVLAEPYFALKKCQCEFMKHLCEVLTEQTKADFDVRKGQISQQNSTNTSDEINSLTEHLGFNVQAQVMYPETFCVTNTYERHASIVKTRHEFEHNYEHTKYPHDMNSRDAVASFVRDYRRHKGRPIFQRPEKFKKVKLQPGIISCMSTYEKVSKMCKYITDMHASNNQRGCEENNEDKASATLQRFWRVVKAQHIMRGLAKTTIEVCHDPESGYYYYLNKNNKKSTWTRPWTLGPN